VGNLAWPPSQLYLIVLFTIFDVIYNTWALFIYILYFKVRNQPFTTKRINLMAPTIRGFQLSSINKIWHNFFTFIIIDLIHYYFILLIWYVVNEINDLLWWCQLLYLHLLFLIIINKSEWVNVVSRQMSKFSAISWREQVTFDEMVMRSALY
jgi:hypothetical protein